MKRRGFISILLVAGIAVVLTMVFLNLFKEKDTTQLAENVNTYVATGYLDENGDEYTKINAYLQDMYSKLTSSEEKSEVKNYNDSYKAFAIIADFYNRELSFTEFSETYKNSRKKIEANLKKAQTSANDLLAFLNDASDKVGESDYWQANTWANCKDYMSSVFTNTNTAFNLLGNVYKASVTSKFLNNDLSTLIIDTTETLTSTVKEKLTTVNVSGRDLYNFVNAYLTINGEKNILNYYYNDNAQNNVKIINEKTTGWEATYNSFLTGTI